MAERKPVLLDLFCGAGGAAMGYIHIVHGFVFAQTFTLTTEPGTSLIAAGWKPVDITKAKKPKKPGAQEGWSSPSRPRDPKKHPNVDKVRWECKCGPTKKIDLAKAIAELEAA